MQFLAVPSRFRNKMIVRLDFGRSIGLIAGLILPLIAALMYRTYYVSLAAQGLESARQLGLIYLAGEMIAIFYARRRGFDLLGIIRLLPTCAKIALGLFLSTFWISSAFTSQMMPFSLGLSLGWFVHLLFAASLYHLARSTSAVNTYHIAIGFSAGLLALAVATAYHFSAVPAALFGEAAQFNQDGRIDLGSAVPGFISSRLFGAWCGAVLALNSGIAWRHDNAQERPMLYMMLALAFGLTIWTATRAALLGWSISLAVAWLLASKPASREIYTRLPFYLIVAAVVGLMLPPYGNQQFSFFRVGGLASADIVTSGRLTLWMTALRVAAHYPLLGSGAGSSWWLVPLDGFYHVQPHNALVQFLLNWGVVPTIPAVSLLAAATWHSHRIARQCRELLPLILMLDCLLTISLFDGMLHFAQFVMLIFGCLAICLARGCGAQGSVLHGSC